MSNAKISIVTICYNAVETIERTIISVVTQTYKNVEYIIVDGASSDGTVDVIKKYLDKITIFISEPDKGIYDAMNKGINAATGEWILFMNAGDRFFDKNVIERCAPLLGDADIASGTAIMTGQKWLAPETENLSLTFFITRSLNHQATFIRTSQIKECGYDIRYKISADTLFFCKKIIFENVKYLKLEENVAICEDSGLSARQEESFNELERGVKEMLPPRMSYDFDFIHLYHNEAVLWFGKTIRKSDFLRSLWHTIKKKKKIRY